jgi:signal transduction histidine kinase/CheY-like chemotaxis protein
MRNGKTGDTSLDRAPKSPREHLTWVLAAAIALVVVVGWSRKTESDARRDLEADALSRIQAQSELRSRILDARRTNLERQVRFLAELPSVAGMLRAHAAGGLDPLEGDSEARWRHRLDQSFLAFARANPEVLKLRLIGEEDGGREVVRVDRRGDSVWSTPEDHLQRKGERGFFKDIAAVPKGTIRLSELDLNQDDGKVEMPPLPTLRAGTPVFDPKGRLFGIILVNLDARPMLRELRTSVPNPLGLYLLNDRGDFLSHPDSSRNFGFDLGRRWTWDREFQGVPGRDARYAKSIRGNILLLDRDTVAVDSGRRWVVVAAYPDSALVRDANRAGRAALLLSLTLAGVVLVFAALWHTGARSREAAAQAKASSRAKADFLANMSHEIRTPMNAILGLVHVLERRSTDREVLETVGRIRRAGSSLQSILDDILDFSRMEAGNLPVEEVPFRLAEVLDNLSTILASAAGGKDLELVIDAPPPATASLVGDPRRLGQILINLAGNAVKFTSKGWVRVGMEVVERTSEGVVVVFSVADTGIGIPRDRLGALFQPFTQADGTTTRRFGGTGLGLAISRLLAERMGGSIAVESEEGKGSTFRVRIPFRTGGSRKTGRIPTNLELLVADDSDLARENLVEIAVSMGWQAHAVADGREALDETFRRSDAGTPFDVLVLDWKMPVLDGLDAAIEVHRKFGGERPPVVILATAFSREEVEAHPGSPHVDAVLQKPVTASSLLDAVTKARAGRDGERGNGENRIPGGDSLRGIRVLVVDDNDINRDVVAAVLGDEGAVVVPCDGGGQALSLLSRSPSAVDIVLLDIQMPEMDGFQVCRRIRAEPSLRDLPVVALTAGTLPHEREAAREAGMDDFLAKPFDPDRLLEVVRTRAGRAPVVDDRPRTPPPAKTIQDVDFERGAALWGSPGAHAKRLAKFVEEQSESVSEIAERIGAGDLGNARFLAHRLKGSAGVLALDRLMSSASDIERALLEGREPGPAVAEARPAMEKVVRIVAEAVPRTPVEEPARPAVPREERVAGLLRLREALDTDDRRQATAALERVEPLLDPRHAAVLRGHVESFDFRRAEAVLLALLAIEEGPGREENLP